MLKTAVSPRPHAIRTAACMIIGDEVLNGKIRDTNSNYFARYCFELGIDVRRVVVVPDEESDIIESLKTLRQYDFVVTSGGIGPTHDDITYESIAKAYGLPLEVHTETREKMDVFSTKKLSELSKDALAARLRMATLPVGDNVSKSYLADDLWMPVVGIDNRVYILPGIPQLFTRLLDSLKPSILLRIDTKVLQRRFISTNLAESSLAKPLGDLQANYKHLGIKFGSYPHMEDKCNTISIIGPEDVPEMEIAVKEVIEFSGGREISQEEESRAH